MVLVEAMLKDIDYEILSGLLENARTSDRELARKIGVSQPTVTRRRGRLENELIDGYTAVPKWKELGYEILAITLAKTAFYLGSAEMRKNIVKTAKKWLDKQPNVIFCAMGRGLGSTGVIFSVHKDYAHLDEFLSNHRQQLGNIVGDVQTIIVNLTGERVYRPLHFKHLAKEFPEKKRITNKHKT
jgi:DNA-binding Lrp family transcriptional regulator